MPGRDRKEDYRSNRRTAEIPYRPQNGTNQAIFRQIMLYQVLELASGIRNLAGETVAVEGKRIDQR